MILATPGLNINSHRDACSAGLVVVTETATVLIQLVQRRGTTYQATAEFEALHKRSVSLEVNTQRFLAHPQAGTLF